MKSFLKYAISKFLSLILGHFNGRLFNIFKEKMKNLSIFADLIFRQI